MINRYARKYKELQMKILEEVLSKSVKKVAAAKLLGVSRVTLDKWLYRYRRFGEEGLVGQRRKQYPPSHNRTSTKLEDLVIKLAEEYWYDGVETLSDRLFEEEKIEMNPSTIYRILKRRDVRYNQHWAGTKKRKKKKLYCHQQLGKELQMDTKYPFGYKQGKVIYTVIDDCSRWSYAKLYHTANAENTLDFIKHLQERCPFPIKKIRTDNGTEFVNHKIRNYLKSINIEWRKNTPYCPEENGKIERFHGTLNQKSISISWRNTDSFSDLEYKLAQFLHYYNYRKRHRGLGMNGLTPFQKIILVAFSQNVNLTLQCNIN
jgi:transposase InsO family protein